VPEHCPFQLLIDLDFQSDLKTVAWLIWQNFKCENGVKASYAFTV
jgi:hypothetical protein